MQSELPVYVPVEAAGVAERFAGVVPSPERGAVRVAVDAPRVRTHPRVLPLKTIVYKLFL